MILVWKIKEGDWYSSYLDHPPPPWVWTLADWVRRIGAMLAIVDVLFAACLPLLNTIVRTRQIQVTGAGLSRITPGARGAAAPGIAP